MRKFFRRENKEQPPTTQEVIHKLRCTEEMLTKRGEFFQKKIDVETDTARKNASKCERAALVALKRKKGFETHLQKIDHTLLTIENHRHALDLANTIEQTLKILCDATKALQSSHRRLDVQGVLATMDDIQQQTALSEPTGNEMDFDEDELRKELEELKQKGGLDEAKSKAKQEDDDLRELEGWTN